MSAKKTTESAAKTARIPTGNGIRTDLTEELTHGQECAGHLDDGSPGLLLRVGGAHRPLAHAEPHRQGARRDGRPAAERSRGGPEGAARRARAPRGALRVSGTPPDGAGARAPADGRLDRLRAAGAADQRRASLEQLSGRSGVLEGGR